MECSLQGSLNQEKAPLNILHDLKKHAYIR